MGDKPEVARQLRVERYQTHTHTLCVQVRGLGSADDRRVQTALFPHGIHIRRVSGISVAFRSILSRVSAELGGQPGGPWGQEEKPPSMLVYPSAPT